MPTKGELIAAAKAVSPLNNPPSAVVAIVNKINKPGNDSIRVEKGVTLPRGKRRVQPAEAILKCQMCGRQQKLTFAFGKPPEWHKCIWCGELQPMDGYRVIAYGLGLPRVLAPHEVKAREMELAELRRV